ncbi:hypothetical protein Tco_1175066 [Tanacetum coccineum]
MEDLIEVSDAKITIRSSLCFLRDVKKKLEETGNEKRNTLFRATIFDKWLDIPAFANDNLLLNYIFHHHGTADIALLSSYSILYLWILNVVPWKNERDSKKDKEKVVEPLKKKKKLAKSSKKKNIANEQSPKKMTAYNLYGFV